MTDEFKNISVDKSKDNFVWIDIIYPKDFLKNILKNQIKAFDVFQKGLVFCFSIYKNPKFKDMLERAINRATSKDVFPIIINLDSVEMEFNKIIFFAKETNKSLPISDFLWSLLVNANGLGSVGIYTNEINYKNGLNVFFASNKKELVDDSKIYVYEQIRKEKIDQLSKKKTSTTKRKAFTKSIRHEVFKKCNYRCVECGATKDQTSLHIDHILPISKGGNDELNNLQILCQACNLAKHNRIYPGET